MRAVHYLDPSGEARLGALQDSTIRDAGPAGPQGFVPTRENWAAIEGASGPEHMLDVLTTGHADAALAASIFHFGHYTIGQVKQYLAKGGVPVRLV